MIELSIATDTPEQLAAVLALLQPSTALLLRMEEQGAEPTEPAEDAPSIQEEPAAEATPPSPPTLADIRAALARVNETMGLLKAKELLHQFGAKRVGDLDVAHYPAFLSAAQEVGA